MQKAVTVALLNPKAKAIISLWPLQYRLSLTRKSSLRPAPWIARRRDMAQVALVTKEKRSLTALTHLSRNPSASGPAIDCLAKMRANDSEGNPISIEDLKAAADDIISMAVSRGSRRMLSNSRIWQVDEGRVKQLGDAAELIPYLEGTIYRYVTFPEVPA
jgi:hypothetical protein